MKGIFELLRNQVETNARSAVDRYVRELSEYHRVKDDRRLYGAVMDFAVFIRRRSVDLAEAGQPLLADDLAAITAAGRQRGTAGFTAASQSNALTMHTSLMLREITEVPGAGDMDGLLSMVGWLSSQAGAARSAYVLGYQEERARLLSVADVLQSLARKLLADEPAASGLARSLGVTQSDDYAVTVVRIESPLPPRPKPNPGALIEPLLRRHRVPVLWRQPDEFAALVPASGTDQDRAAERALPLVRDLAAITERPCAAGTVPGRVGDLAAAAALARRISQVAPAEHEPDHVYTMADVFVELGLAQLPPVDTWLYGLTRTLLGGPDLVTTLDAFYRADMSRLRTAAALHIHPRTLDYRLQRVRSLTGVDPATVRGIRMLSAAVARIRAGAWDLARPQPDNP
ncbi:helix-turn-helix domain-containing protein [Streptomyces sp. NBC_01352]|uniref:PucR family transcriptional regulator n=1 Tax=Streptomyces sp. NBC_01352 TaxID=2903834 RepID=UPI002E2F1E1A|nr:helix-turn-helix domain-containing protein [Streptomyces sp. NBC_01352]